MEQGCFQNVLESKALKAKCESTLDSVLFTISKPLIHFVISTTRFLVKSVGSGGVKIGLGFVTLLNSSGSTAQFPTIFIVFSFFILDGVIPQTHEMCSTCSLCFPFEPQGDPGPVLSYGIKRADQVIYADPFVWDGSQIFWPDGWHILLPQLVQIALNPSRTKHTSIEEVRNCNSS